MHESIYSLVGDDENPFFIRRNNIAEAISDMSTGVLLISYLPPSSFSLLLFFIFQLSTG